MFGKGKTQTDPVWFMRPKNKSEQCFRTHTFHFHGQLSQAWRRTLD